MKRADLDTETVLVTVADLGQSIGYAHLCTRFPPKVVDAAFAREVQAGRMDYGVSLRTAWVEPAGHSWLAERKRGNASS